MIADWTVDVGPDSPSIEVPWEGWVDLRGEVPDACLPWREDLARSLPETAAYPELVPLLEVVNSLNTVSSKVDVFPVSSAEVDPEIAEIGERETRFGLGSYLDIVPIRPRDFARFEDFEALARKTVDRLRRIEMPACCAEVVIRPARVHGEPTYGFTLYAMGFGPTETEARKQWGAAAASVVAAVECEIASCGIEPVPSHLAPKQPVNTGE